jgi:hypothetical protein
VASHAGLWRGGFAVGVGGAALGASLGHDEGVALVEFCSLHDGAALGAGPSSPSSLSYDFGWGVDQGHVGSGGVVDDEFVDGRLKPLFEPGNGRDGTENRDGLVLFAERTGVVSRGACRVGRQGGFFDVDGEDFGFSSLLIDSGFGGGHGSLFFVGGLFGPALRIGIGRAGGRR